MPIYVTRYVAYCLRALTSGSTRIFRPRLHNERFRYIVSMSEHNLEGQTI
jgi:hypothetical protein